MYLNSKKYKYAHQSIKNKLCCACAPLPNPEDEDIITTQNLLDLQV